MKMPQARVICEWLSLVNPFFDMPARIAPAHLSPRRAMLQKTAAGHFYNRLP
jgi:hypothetical protein